MASTLESLPSEMQCAIAEHVKDGDIFALRLTCRAMSAASLDALCERFFKIRKHLFTFAGLNNLIEIMSSPHLLKKLQRIEFALVAFKTPQRLNTPEGIATLQPVPGDEVVGMVPGRTFDVAALPQAEAHWNHACSLFTKDGNHINVLNQIFAGLHGKTYPPVFAFDSQCIDRSSFGFAAVQRLIGPTLTDTCLTRAKSQSVINEALHAMNTASAMSERRLERLYVMKSALDHTAFDLPESLRSEAWCKLLSLELRCTTDMVEHTDSHFPEFLRSLRRLKVLYLFGEAGYDSTGGDCIRLLLDTIPSRKLCELTLLNMDTNAQDLLLFLSKHKSTLKTVRLRGISLPDRGSWVQVLEGLHNNVSLQEVAIQRMAVRPETERKARLLDTQGKNNFTFHRDGIQPGLKGILDDQAFEGYSRKLL